KFKHASCCAVASDVLNGWGCPFEGRKYSGSRIGLMLAVFEEERILLLVPFFPAPLEALLSLGLPLIVPPQLLRGPCKVLQGAAAPAGGQRKRPLPLGGRVVRGSSPRVQPADG